MRKGISCFVSSLLKSFSSSTWDQLPQLRIWDNGSAGRAFSCLESQNPCKSLYIGEKSNDQEIKSRGIRFWGSSEGNDSRVGAVLPEQFHDLGKEVCGGIRLSPTPLCPTFQRWKRTGTKGITSLGSTGSSSQGTVTLWEYSTGILGYCGIKGSRDELPLKKPQIPNHSKNVSF